MEIYRLKIPRLKIPNIFKPLENQDVALKITNIKTPNTIVFTTELLFCLIINSLLYTHVYLVCDFHFLFF